jgi:hypothetical protein
MTTGVKSGLTPARTLGNISDNAGLDEFKIASGYSTSLFTGDIVQLSATGNLEVCAAGGDAIGVFMGCRYTDSAGEIQYKKYWPASTVAADAKGLVSSYQGRTFRAKANGTVAQVDPTEIFVMDTTVAGNAATGRSGMTVRTLATATGDVDIEDVADLGATVTGLVDNDAFTVKTSQESGAATAIVIANGEGTEDLLAKINAVDNVRGSLTSGGFLKIEATDGYSLILANATNTPLVDFGITAGTFTSTVAANAGHVKVVSVVDADNRELEVYLVNHEVRDDG